MKKALLLLSLLSCFPGQAQVPSFGSMERIDLASWNLMWYGHAVYGSTNKARQRSSVGQVLRNAKIDIWCFQEVCDTGDFSDLLRESGPFHHIYASYWQDQKIAWVWDSTQWTLIHDTMLFKDSPQDFASGRLPVLVVLVAKNRADTLFLVGVHLKAHTGSDPQKQEAYFNRKVSGEHLNSWKDMFSDRRVIVAGDWNDDMDKSVFNDTVSPFAALKNAGTFLLEKQALAGEKTWYFGDACIDHIWVNQKTKEIYTKGSAQILLLDWYFGKYPEEVSDHFPVFASLEPTRSLGLPVDILLQPRIGPNPSRGTFYLDISAPLPAFVVLDLQGKNVSFQQQGSGGRTEIHIHTEGIYFLFLKLEEQVFVYRLVVTP